MRSKNLHELVLSAAARWGKRPAFRHVYGGKVRELAYEDLPRLTFLFAQALVARGVKEGDRVVLCADNCPEWVIACLSIMRLGATVVPVDSRSRQADIELVAEKVKPALFILGRMQFGLLRETLDESRIVLLDQFLASITTTDGDRPSLIFKSIGSDTPALIVFTSGTSGVAKGVVLTHANIAANVEAITERFRVDNTDRLLSILPLSHMFEFTAGLIGPLEKGACMVYSRLRGPDQLRELLRVERINVLIGVPAIYQNVLKAIEARIAQLPKNAQMQANIARKVVSSGVGGTQMSSMVMGQILREFGGTIKFWAAGGAPVPAELVKGLASFGIPVLAGYGLTEASPIVAANTHTANRPGSVGKPLRNVEVKIRPLESSDKDAETPVGTPGEILVRGTNVMSGYFDDEEATAQVLKDGWLYTGDVGHVDNDGFLYVTGRIKSTIVTSGGYNIHPEELERALEQSPMIKESCVFGVQSDLGEQAHAIIVAAPAVADKATDKEYFRAEIARCFADLAEYKRLAGFEIFQGELPRTRTNKIQRSKAAEMYEGLRANAPVSTGSEIPKLDADGEMVLESVAEVMDPTTVTKLGTDGITPRSALCADLGIDSFARLELAVRLEQKFQFDLPEEALNDVQTLEELVTLVKSRKQRGSASTAEVPQSESANFDALMALYSSFAEPGSAQAKRLATAVMPWPHGRPIISEITIGETQIAQTARQSIVAALRLVLAGYNRFERIGREKLEIKPPYIVVANHTSHIDTAALFASFPLRLVPIVHPVAATDTFFNNRVSAEISTNVLNAVPFDRYGDFETSLLACKTVLQRGEILIIFPEGTRSMTGRTGPFRSGVSQLAISVGCPVVPAYIQGGVDVLPKKGRVPKPGKLRVVFGDALHPPPATTDLHQIQEFTKKLEEAVARLGESLS